MLSIFFSFPIQLLSFLVVPLVECEALLVAYMLFSKDLRSSEFSRKLISTMASASLLPGNRESSAAVLKVTKVKLLLDLQPSKRSSHLSMASTSTEETPSSSFTLLAASWLN